ncbi:hypothetical protein PV328_009482 [Microctonus aethiopoides]|uniref:Major facilitator superfamily (MFS) profile domain-containing protein n=1 Tax=Microctonus aethiopoides TaxID=144406 RepID=A0AA39C5V7_9HYME|nr:hypothetical protein PV328_009482 [Microctonus aethiopoides]
MTVTLNDKDQDNGINIKFGNDRDGRGDYRSVSTTNSRNKKTANGTTKQSDDGADIFCIEVTTVHTGSINQVKYASGEGQMVPPDGGWGWLVLLAAVMVNVLIPGAIKSFGVLFVEFTEVFHATSAATLWIPALCYFLYSSLGPLSSILSVKYSYRTVSLIGGTFAAVGMMISYFADSVLFLCVSYGICVGIGAGLSFPPTVYIVTSYFVRLRGLANGLCISGSALGSIFLPPVLRILLEQFGYRGAVLIMGGLMLNVWAAALLYDPVEKHMIRAPATSDSGIDETNENEEDEIGGLIEEEKKLNNALINSMTMNEKVMGIVPKSASSVALENYKKTPVQGRTRKISVPTGREITSQMHSTPALHAVPERGIYRRKPGARSPSSSSFNYISTPYHGSTLSALQPEYASNLTLNAISNTFRKSPEKTVKAPEEKKTKFFDFSLLKDPIYLVILISNSTNAVSYTNFVILLPIYGTSLGYDKDSATYLLSLVSVFDLIGRIGGAALSDLKLMPKHWYFVGGLLISGISLTMMPTSMSYSILASYCGVFGLASGVYVGVTAVIMADMLGTEKLTSSYGISLFVNGVIQLVGPPICGLVYDEIQSFGPIFSILGIVLIVGASLWSIVPFIRKRQQANIDNLAQDNKV